MTGTASDHRPIVVGVDASESARAAALWAADLAAVRRCPLHLVHVVPGRYGESHGPVLLGWLHEVTASAVRAGADAVGEVVGGAVAPTLLARAEGAAMLVVGSYGEAAWSRTLAGSLAPALAGGAGCPVAVVRGRAPQLAPPRAGAVVVGTDGADTDGADTDGADTAAAVLLGAELADESGAALLVVVHAVGEVPTAAGGRWRPPGDRAELLAAAERRADEQVALVRERFPRLRVERSVVPGTELRVLLDRAGAARMIVVGRRPSGASADPPVLGPTGRALVECAACPVVVAPSGSGVDAPVG